MGWLSSLLCVGPEHRAKASPVDAAREVPGRSKRRKSLLSRLWRLFGRKRRPVVEEGKSHRVLEEEAVVAEEATEIPLEENAPSVGGMEAEAVAAEDEEEEEEHEEEDDDEDNEDEEGEDVEDQAEDQDIEEENEEEEDVEDEEEEVDDDDEDEDEDDDDEDEEEEEEGEEVEDQGEDEGDRDEEEEDQEDQEDQEEENEELPRDSISERGSWSSWDFSISSSINPSESQEDILEEAISSIRWKKSRISSSKQSREGKVLPNGVMPDFLEVMSSCKGDWQTATSPPHRLIIYF